MASSNDENVDELIQSAMESISRIREVTSALPIPNRSSNRCRQNTASELTRLFPTFRSASETRHRAAGPSNNNTTRCSPPRKRRRGNSSEVPSKKNIIHKDLVILKNSQTTKVPTHKARLALEKKGRVVHDFPFNRKWNEYELCAAVEKEMPSLLGTEYEFLKVNPLTI